MKDPSRAHSPRPNRNINIILTTTYVESIAASTSALLIRDYIMHEREKNTEQRMRGL
jgi:hypothetical protein